MENTDNLLGDFASGDGAAPPLTPQVVPAPAVTALKRDHDSTDDFEHLDRDGKREDDSGFPVQNHGTARAATQSFLDMERDEFVDTPRAPSVTEKFSDHLADKFTDSESEGTAGESPMHRAAPPAPVVTSALPSSTSPVPEPAHAAFTSVPPVITSQPVHETPKPATVPEPTVIPAPVAKATAELVPEIKPDVKSAQPAPQPEPVTTPKPVAAPTPAAPPKPMEPAPIAAKSEPKPVAPISEPARAPVAHVIEAEVIFCQMGLDAWFDPQRLHPEVESLVYWRKPAQSGAALGGGLALLVALACCSVVSVLAYCSLLALCAAVAFRIYKNVLQAVQKTNEGHPFKWLLEADISVPADRAQSLAAAATAHLNAAVHELRRLFLVEDLVDSLKFGVMLWCLTYVGACFNGITLIILGWIALFTLPKAYEMNKSQVDANLELARAKINDITAKVRAAVPLGRKAESDKDK